MPAEDLRDLVAQLEAGRAELLDVAVRLAVRLRCADPDQAKKAANEIRARRAGLAESPVYEALVTADIPGPIVRVPLSSCLAGQPFGGERAGERRGQWRQPRPS